MWTGRPVYLRLFDDNVQMKKGVSYKQKHPFIKLNSGGVSSSKKYNSVTTK